MVSNSLIFYFIFANALAMVVSSMVSNLIGAAKDKEVIPTVWRVLKFGAAPYYLSFLIMIFFSDYGTINTFTSRANILMSMFSLLARSPVAQFDMWSSFEYTLAMLVPLAGYAFLCSSTSFGCSFSQSTISSSNSFSSTSHSS